MMSPVFTCLLSIPRGGTIEMSRIRALAPDLLIASHGSKAPLVSSNRLGKAGVDIESNFSSCAGRDSLMFEYLILHTAAIVLVFMEEDGLYVPRSCCWISML